MQVYRVGGAVRDRLLGLPVKDNDWVVIGARPEDLLELGYKAVGQDFPVFLHPDTGEEYALARTERKSGPGYKGFVFNSSPHVSLEEDLQRRDLTINALAEDDDGNIIDPFNGQADLRAGVLRHVSPAFVEDPLRVLRVARFAARFNYRVAEETLAFMQDIVKSGELDSLVPERVWTETLKALEAPFASRFIEVLRDSGALAEVFPEIDVLYGIPQPAEHHPEIDCGIHTVMVLQQACRLTEDAQIRFAALVHDLGKGTTPEDQWPGHRGHEQRSVELIEDLCERIRVPTRFRELALLVARYHLDCHRIREMKAATVLKKLEALDVFRRPERLQAFLLACEADARGRKGFEERDYPQAAYLQDMCVAALAVDTSDFADSQLGGNEIATLVRERRVKAISEAMEK